MRRADSNRSPIYQGHESSHPPNYRLNLGCHKGMHVDRGFDGLLASPKEKPMFARSRNLLAI